MVFFNADYFKREVLNAAGKEGDGLRWFAIDMIPITQFDITGIDAIAEIDAELARRGVQLVCAGRRAETTLYFESRGLPRLVPIERHFTTLRKARRAYCEAMAIAEPARQAEDEIDPDDSDEPITT